MFDAADDVFVQSMMFFCAEHDVLCAEHEAFCIR